MYWLRKLGYWQRYWHRLPIITPVLAICQYSIDKVEPIPFANSANNRANTSCIGSIIGSIGKDSSRIGASIDTEANNGANTPTSEVLVRTDEVSARA